LDFDVFVSHKSADDGLVNHLVEALEKVGVRCFVDHRDRKGGGWDDLIRLAGASPAVIVLITPNSYDDCTNVFNEAIVARDKKRRIIPVITPDVVIGDGRLGSQFRAELYQHWDKDGDPTVLATIVAGLLGIVPRAEPDS